MARRREPARYQLPFEFTWHTGETTAVPRALLQDLASEQATSRGVRRVQEEVVVHTAADAAHYLLHNVFVPFDQFDQEELWLLLLSTRQRITHEVMLYRGTIDQVPVRVAEILKEAVRVNAPVILLAHNHPSGAVSPSLQDVQITRLVDQASTLLGIQCLDHLIVGKQTWTSLRACGLGFAPATHQT
jgi:DNA repair protein RadC